MGKLDKKVAIVTGGASGIGLATVKALIEQGVTVVISDLNEPPGVFAEQELKKNGAEVLFIKVNVAEEKSVENLVTETVNRYGKVDILINNAGIGGLNPTHTLTFEQYNKIISVNQHGVFFAAKHVIREMLKTGGGCIVNTASILSTVGLPETFAYTASKGAVLNLTKTLALEYADKNIRVNAISPGFLESGTVNREANNLSYKELIAKHPIGRLGKPEEIAHAIIFLCENDFVTGTSLIVDGGYTAR
ncbi:SDR family NAD(P)-dependent oxidoreductase [Peribacillus sp. NPDC097206]|uniref:SDR family NAD(P)-dependent oxidoreductase n=1 Tax=unclassified Peribacillus TaxID=2675266 RepID=UPI00382EBFA9